MIDLTDLQVFTEGVPLEELTLVHITEAAGGPDWALRRADGEHTRLLPLGARDLDSATRIIEAVGLAPDESVTVPEHDQAWSLQPGSETRSDEAPV